MELKPLSRTDCQKVRVWRNSDMRPWRTPYRLTKQMQNGFFKNIVNDRNSNHRYFGVWESQLVGMAGLTYIQWENSLAEITLIIDPVKQNQGLGERAVDLILDYAYNTLNLKTVFGEAYLSNPAVDFWKKVVDRYQGYSTMLPDRKYWSGKFWDSLYFSVSKENFKEKDNAKNKV